MKKVLVRAAIGLSALFACVAPAAAQHATISTAPAGYAPEEAQVTVPAISTPCTGTITSTAATSTAVAPANDPVLAARFPACTASFSGGVGKLGPFVPQLGRAVRVVSEQSSAFAGSWYVGTSTNGCTTVNRLTSDDTVKADWTGQVNDYLDVPPTTGNVAYCAVGTITSGTLALATRN